MWELSDLGEYVYDVGFVDSVEAEDISVGEKLKVRVSGGWPSPAWELDHDEVEVVEDKVTVKVVGRMNPEVMAPTVIEPFEHVVEVEGLSAGVYTVEAVGRGENQTVQVTVHPVEEKRENPE